jgi:hypothetical protein
VSLRAGLSGDGLRNWKRKTKDGSTDGAINVLTLSKVAEVLGVSREWLLTGIEHDRSVQHPPGLQDSATPFDFVPSKPPNADMAARNTAPLHAIFGGDVGTPGTYRVANSLAGFGCQTGDILILDLARLPHAGELAIVSMFDDAAGTGVTLLRRYLPPYLLSGETDLQPEFLRVDNPGITVRYPVIGLIRGVRGT